MAAVSVAGGIRIRGRSWCGTHGMWIRVSQAGQGSSVLGFTARHVLGGDAAGSSVLLYEHPEQPGIGVVLNNGPGPAGPSKQAEWEVALYRPPDEVAPLPGVGWDQRVPLCGDEFDERDFEGLSNDDDQLARGRGTRRVAVLTPDGTVEMWLYARGVKPYRLHPPTRAGGASPCVFIEVLLLRERLGSAEMWELGATASEFRASIQGGHSGSVVIWCGTDSHPVCGVLVGERQDGWAIAVPWSALAAAIQAAGYEVDPDDIQVRVDPGGMAP